MSQGQTGLPQTFMRLGVDRQYTVIHVERPLSEKVGRLSGGITMRFLRVCFAQADLILGKYDVPIVFQLACRSIRLKCLFL
jgi:hypothetical protein